MSDDVEKSDIETKSDEKKDETEKDLRNLLAPDVERWPVGDKPVAVMKGVSKSFGKNQVLKDLSLTIEAGKITIIVGASGSGKSVLIKHLNGLLRADSGSVEIFGQDLTHMEPVELAKARMRIGTMFQNYALFDSMTVVENVAFPLVEHNVMKAAEAEKLAAELLVDLGLGDSLKQYPATLSGGMKKRVSLARAIITNPEIVLFDEPTTGLDPVMMEFVDHMIKDITVRYGLTSVLISHDITTIFRLADSVAVLHDGQIIAQGSPEEVRAMDNEHVQNLLGGEGKADIDSADAADQTLGDDVERVVNITGVHKAFSGKKVLRNIDFSVAKDKLTVLIGGSGSGKSVLMKHILGLLKPDSGEIKVFGQSLSGMSERDLRELRTRIGMLFQHAALFDSMTVLENIAFPLIERRVCSTKEAHERSRELMEKLDLTKVSGATPLEISSGQQKRVSLARALVTSPELMIYDEPTTGQDPLKSRYVEEMIVQVQNDFDVSSVVISHDMASAFRIADYIAMLYKGEIIAFGPPAVILESEDERVREFVFAAKPEVADA